MYVDRSEKDELILERTEGLAGTQVSTCTPSHHYLVQDSSNHCMATSPK